MNQGQGPDNPASSAAIASALGYTPANRALTPEVLKATGLIATSTLGVTTEQAMGFVQVPAGKITANSCVEIENIWNTIGSNGSVVITIRIIAGQVGAGITGTQLVFATLGTGLNVPWRNTMFFKNSVGAQSMFSNGPSPGVAGAAGFLSGAVDGSLGFTLRFNITTNSALDQVSLLYYKAVHVPAFVGA